LKGSAGDPDRVVFSEGGYGTFEKRDNEGDESHGFQPGVSVSQIYYPKALQQLEHPESVIRAVSARSMSHKLVLRSDPATGDHCSELYDLHADPDELSNLYNNTEHSIIQAKLSQKILEWFMQTSDVTPWQFDDRSGDLPWPPRSRLPSHGPAVGGTRGPHDFAEYSPPEYGPAFAYHI